MTGSGAELSGICGVDQPSFAAMMQKTVTSFKWKVNFKGCANGGIGI